jgi:hypothetical protein
VFDAAGVAALHADAEVALEVGPDGIAGYGAALELVDLGSPPDNPHDLGERLEPGDRLITGSVVQVPLGDGDRVIADLGSLGRVELAIA